MNIIFIFSILLSLIFSSYSEPDICELTNQNFHSVLNLEPIALVNFYTDWCGYCKSTNSEFTIAAKELELQNINAKLYKLNANDANNDEVIENEQINGFPSLVLYKYGKKIEEYNGRRSSRDIIKFLKLKSEPRVTEINEYNDIEPYIEKLKSGEFLENNIVSIILGVFPEGDSEDPTAGINGSLARSYIQTTKFFDLSLFFITKSEEIQRRFGIQEDSLVIFNDLDEEHNMHHTIISLDKETSNLKMLEHFVKNSMPLVIPYSKEIQPILSALPLKEHVLIFFDSNNIDTKFIEMIEVVCLKYIGRLALVEIGSQEHFEHQILNYFSIQPKDLPQLFVVNMTEKDNFKKYSFGDYIFLKYFDPKGNSFLEFQPFSLKKEFNGKEYYIPYKKEDIEEFFQSYFQGTAFQSLLSESVDIGNKKIHQKKSRLETIVGLNFDEKVLGNDETDVLVYFHAPWCAYCKSIEPIIHEVANLYQDDLFMKVYKIDGTKNEISHPGVKIDGFPTFYFFKAHEKQQPIEFDGERTTDAIIEFLNSQRNFYEEEDITDAIE